MISLAGCEPDYGQPGTIDHDDQYSAHWDGEYVGSCFFSGNVINPNDVGYRNMTMRIQNLGDNDVRIQCYLTPGFSPSERTGFDVKVTRFNNLRAGFVRDNLWYVYTFGMSEGHLQGSLNCYPLDGDSGDPDWLLSFIDVRKP